MGNIDTSGWTGQLFGDTLRQLRRAAGLTQAELAERANLSIRGLSDLERGINRSPRRETLLALADAFGLDREERHRFFAAARPRPPLSPLSPRHCSRLGLQSQIRLHLTGEPAPAGSGSRPTTSRSSSSPMCAATPPTPTRTMTRMPPNSPCALPLWLEPRWRLTAARCWRCVEMRCSPSLPRRGPHYERPSCSRSRWSRPPPPPPSSPSAAGLGWKPAKRLRCPVAIVGRPSTWRRGCVLERHRGRCWPGRR